jgi:hypothetical protein
MTLSVSPFININILVNNNNNNNYYYYKITDVEYVPGPNNVTVLNMVYTDAHLHSLFYPQSAPPVRSVLQADQGHSISRE